jgi:hypothetical protein
MLQCRTRASSSINGNGDWPGKHSFNWPWPVLSGMCGRNVNSLKRYQKAIDSLMKAYLLPVKQQFNCPVDSCLVSGKRHSFFGDFSQRFSNSLTIAFQKKRENSRKIAVILVSGLGRSCNANGIPNIMQHLVRSTIKLHLVRWELLTHRLKLPARPRRDFPPSP